MYCRVKDLPNKSTSLYERNHVIGSWKEMRKRNHLKGSRFHHISNIFSLSEVSNFKNINHLVADFLRSQKKEQNKQRFASQNLSSICRLLHVLFHHYCSKKGTILRIRMHYSWKGSLYVFKYLHGLQSRTAQRMVLTTKA